MNKKLTYEINNYLKRFSVRIDEIIANSQKYKEKSPVKYQIYKEDRSVFYVIAHDLRIKTKLKEYLLKSFPNCEIKDEYSSIFDVLEILKTINSNQKNNKIIFLDDNPEEHHGCGSEDEKFYKTSNEQILDFLYNEFEYKVDIYFTEKVRLYLDGKKEIENSLGGKAKIHIINEFAKHTIDYYFNLVSTIFPTPEDFNKNIKALVLVAPHNFEFINFAKNALKSKINNIEVYDRRDPNIYSLSYIDDFTENDFIIVDGESLEQFIYIAKILKIGIKAKFLFSSKTIYAYTKGIIDTFNLDSQTIFLNSFPSQLFTDGETIFNFDQFLKDAKRIFKYILPNYVEDLRKFRLSPLSNESFYVCVPIVSKTIEYMKTGRLENVKDTFKILNYFEHNSVKDVPNEKIISRLVNIVSEKRDVIMILLEMMFFSYNNYEKGLKLEYKDMINRVKAYKENMNENILHTYIPYCSLVISFLINLPKTN